jgi:hypothetical protein
LILMSGIYSWQGISTTIHKKISKTDSLNLIRIAINKFHWQRFVLIIATLLSRDLCSLVFTDSLMFIFSFIFNI